MATQYSCLENPMDRERSLVGYSPWGCRKVRHDLGTKQQLLLEYCKCVGIKGVPAPLEHQRNLILGVSREQIQIGSWPVIFPDLVISGEVQADSQWIEKIIVS